MIRSFLVACVLAACALGTPAAAQEYYNHNGSRVVLNWDNVGDGFSISYVRPRPDLPVSPGTVLFHGTWAAGGQIYGTAYIFSRSCRPIGYTVRGNATPYGFYADGAAPIRNDYCQVVRYVWNNNSHLEFYEQ